MGEKKSQDSNKTPATVFTKDFTQQESIPEDGIARAVEIMKSGRLHRYNIAQGEVPETSQLEQEFALYMGRKYCAAFSSCGSSLHVALKCLGVRPGDRVLCNGFTLAPVPGAIFNAGAEPVLVEINDDYTIDPDDLEKKADASNAKYLMLSLMRGHLPDMDRIADICQRKNLQMVEDCAHTLGAKWDGRLSGTFGEIACFSTQTYKHMNSGEGGLLVTDDHDLAAQAILYSGSYMLYETHLSRPSLDVFERHKKTTPNFSLRMSNMQAAILRPQLRELDANCRRWNERYRAFEEELKNSRHLHIPSRSPREQFVASSMQFNLTGLSREQTESFLSECDSRGVAIKWFGRTEPHGFTSTYESWRYLGPLPGLPRTQKILEFLCDFRIPLTFSLEDCRVVARVIRESLESVLS